MTQRWWTLVAVVAGVFMLVVDITIVNVALPEIGDDFDASLSGLQWVVNAYALALAAGLVTGGSLADLWGRRRMYAVGVGLFTACSLLCGLATGPLFLALARAGQGIGGAILWATSLALLSEAFAGGDGARRRERGMAFGVYGAVAGGSVAAGPLLGGLLTSGLNWRWIFFVNVPVGLAVVAVTLAKVAESRGPAAVRPDWAGFAAFGGTLVLLVYGLTESSGGWGRPSVVGCLVGAAVLCAAFVAVEARRREPMLDLRLFRTPTFTGGLVAAFGLSASIYSLFTFLVLYFQDELGFSPAETGVRFLALTAAMFAASTVAGRLAGAGSARWLIGGGFGLVGVGVLLMGGLVETEGGWTRLLPGMLVAGAGSGMVTVSLAATAVGVVRPAQAGMASGINATARQIGLATGIATLGSVFAARTADGGFVDGFRVILWVGGGVALAAGAASVLLIRARDFVQAPPRQPGPAGASAAETPGAARATDSAGRGA
ncbi:MFS transporter [Streptomyces radicis]|uniref:MFS transporter n=1 Tax=Streptomyces radicis TaxID=1750517 RepID=A0A3A9W1Q4_9ACTN|nr:MFS transporter [Streptomyces radicis]RKN19518.1 MFS transporter [Streptomyces radicis]